MARFLRGRKSDGDRSQAMGRPSKKAARGPSSKSHAAQGPGSPKSEARRRVAQLTVFTLLLVGIGTVVTVLWRRIGKMTVVVPRRRQEGYQYVSGYAGSSATPAASAGPAPVPQGIQSDLLVGMAQFADAASEYLKSIRVYYQHTERDPHAVSSDLLSSINVSSDRFVRANGRLLAARSAAGAAFQDAIDDFMVKVNTVVDEEADTSPQSERPDRRIHEALTAAIERIQAVASKDHSAS